MANVRKTELGTIISPQWTEDYTEQVKQVEQEKGKAICGAKKRKDKTPCTNSPLKNGSGRCKFHGGASTGPKDQVGNTNALKTGYKADNLKNRLYQKIYGTEPELEDPLTRTNRMQEIGAGLVYRYIENNFDNLDMEKLERVIKTMQIISNTDINIYNTIQAEKERLLQSPLTAEQLQEMTAEERLKYVNNLILISTLSKSDELKMLYETISKALKSEGDLSLKTEDMSGEEFDEELDLEIDGVD